MNWKTLARRVSLAHKDGGSCVILTRAVGDDEVLVDITPDGCELRVQNRQLTAADIRKWIYEQRRWIDPKNPKRKDKVHGRLFLYSLWDAENWQSIVGAGAIVDRRIAARMKEHLEVPSHGQNQAA